MLFLIESIYLFRYLYLVVELLYHLCMCTGADTGAIFKIKL